MIMIVYWKLSGTNVTGAKKLLFESGLPITAANDFEEVAKKAVDSLSWCSLYVQCVCNIYNSHDYMIWPGY